MSIFACWLVLGSLLWKWGESPYFLPHRCFVRIKLNTTIKRRKTLLNAECTSITLSLKHQKQMRTVEERREKRA